MPSAELLAAMGQFNEQLAKAGILLDGAGLTPSSRGARVRFSGAGRSVSHGPFPETGQLIAGFWVWKVRSLQEAIDWVRKCPNPMLEDSDIEIRPFFEAEDFGEAFTPELREQEAATLATTLGLDGPTFQHGPTLRIAGLNQVYDPHTRAGIPRQWEAFVPRAGSIPGRQGAMFYGVCWNTQPDRRFDYLAGVEFANDGPLPADFTLLTLGAGRYAVFRHGGHVSTISQTIDTIWTKWVPACGLKPAPAPCFERYTAEFHPGTGTGGMEIWIPLEEPA